MVRPIRFLPSGRVIHAIASDARRAYLLGLACETDFLAESEDFVAFARELSEHMVRSDPDGLADGERPLLGQAFASGTVARAVERANRTFGEVVRLTRFARLESLAGRVDAYVHHDHHVGAIVSLAAPAPPEELERWLRSLCQHVVAFAPACVDHDHGAGAPAGEALLDQPWIHDSTLRVREALVRELGPEARVEGFRLLRLRR